MNFDWSLRYEIPCVALLDCLIGWVHCLIGRDQKLSRFDIVIIAIALKRLLEAVAFLDLLPDEYLTKTHCSVSITLSVIPR